MSRRTEPPGICRTCRSGMTCELISTANEPVLQCEQFEPVAPVIRSTPKRPAGSLLRAAEQSDSDSSGHLGLCRSCQNRDGCTYPRQEAGVWHCEEYQ